MKIKNNYQSESLADDEEALSEQDKNQEEVFLRLAAVEDAERVINGLYEHWIRIRLNTRQQALELARMRQQIEQRLGSYITKNDSKSVIPEHAIEA